MPDLVDRLRIALADRYLLLRELGGGGMSRVFVGEETALGRRVVIKILPPDLAAILSTERFRREIHLAASLQHPHIVPLLSAGEAAGLLYYSMPLVEGESLRSKLAREGELPVSEAVRILRDVADALSYAHRHGVVHRDIKPENVLLSGQHAQVTDFGVAKALDDAGRDSSVTATGVALGTPAYMAPEQAAADPHTDHRADIYALGVVGYEILAGRPPFTGPSPQAIVAAQLTQTPVPLAESRPSVPAVLAELVMRCLEKRPADRWQSTTEVLAALEAMGATATGVTPIADKAAQRVRPSRRLLLAAAGAVGLVAAAATWHLFRSSSHSVPLEADLIAVAPFDVPDPRLTLWREGLVDVLSRSLDGAGPLRTVAPTTVIRRWSGRADRPSATRLGRDTRARLVVFGSVLGAGPDSARITATAFDALEQHPLAEIELRDAANRMDRLTDSLAVRLLRELGRSRRIEVLRSTAMGSTSLPALKAFLQGEQWFRRAAWDSALAAYQRAVALDSTFPLAIRRAGQVLGWQRSASDSLSEAWALRAGELNHGLAPRDSMLLTTDSLLGSLYSTAPDVDWTSLQRVHAVARELTRRHPDDFESWYVLGEVLYHWGSALGGTPRQALEAFDRAIGKDSLFAPAYIHPVELALWLDGPEAGHRYARRYVRLGPTDISAAGIRLVDSLMDGGPRAPAEIVQVLRGHAPSALIDAWGAMRRSSDSAEGVIAIARALVDAPEGDAPWRTQAEREQELGVSLLYRGHVGEAMETLYRNSLSRPLHLVEAALLRPAPDSAVGMFRQWIDEGPVRRAELVLPWLMARGDSVSIRRLERRADSLAARRAGPPGRNVALHAAAAARAYLSLLRRDTATAIGRFEALPDSLCPLCYIHHLTLARLYSATRADRKAAQLLDRWLMVLLTPSEVFWTLERARVAERLGDREKASRDYQYVVAVWRHAEPDLQPYVAEAREGLSRLAAEPRQ